MNNRATSSLVGGFAALVLMLFSAMSLFVSFFALFLGPVSRDLSWSLVTFPQGMLTYSIAYSLVAPFSGRLSDQVSALLAFVLGCLCTAAGLVSLSFMTGSTWQLVGSATLLGLGGTLVGPPTLARRVSMYFEKRRGVAMGIIFGAGPMLAAGALSPLISSTVAELGWRTTYRGMAVACVVASLLMVLVLKLVPPGEDASGEEDCKMAPGLGVRAAVGQRTFWIILAVSILMTCSFGGVTSHLVAIATESGQSAAFGATLMSAAFLSGVAGPVLSGLLADWLNGPKAFLPFLGAALIGYAMLSFQVEGAAMMAAAGLIGIGFSAWSGQTALLITRYFGLRAPGAIDALVFASGSIFLGLGPVLLGVLHRSQGNYHFALNLCLGFLVIAFALVSLLGPFASFQQLSAQASNEAEDGASRGDEAEMMSASR